MAGAGDNAAVKIDGSRAGAGVRQDELQGGPGGA